MNRFKKKRKFFQLKNLLLAGGVGLFISVLFIFFRSNLFTIKSVNVNFDKINCTDSETLKNFTNILGQNFFLVNSSKIKKDIMNKFYCVKDVALSREFPYKVNLSITGREALIKLLKLESSNEATISAYLENLATPSAKEDSIGFLVDSEGVIFSTDSARLDIPIVYFENLNLSLGNKLDNLGEMIIRIIEKVKSFGLALKASENKDNMLIIFSTPKIIFRLDEIETQIASLQLILNKAKIDNVSLEFIDLRFDKPIVKFAPKKI